MKSSQRPVWAHPGNRPAPRVPYAARSRTFPAGPGALRGQFSGVDDGLDSPGGPSKPEIEEFVDRNKDKLHRCTKCRLYFPSREFLQQHLISHANDSRIGCLHCSEVFDTEGTYAVHKVYHVPQSVHICANCRGRFVNRLALKRHLIRCTTTPIQHSNNWAKVIGTDALSGEDSRNRARLPEIPPYFLAGLHDGSSTATSSNVAGATFNTRFLPHANGGSSGNGNSSSNGGTTTTTGVLSSPSANNDSLGSSNSGSSPASGSGGSASGASSTNVAAAAVSSGAAPAAASTIVPKESLMKNGQEINVKNGTTTTLLPPMVSMKSSDNEESRIVDQYILKRLSSLAHRAGSGDFGGQVDKGQRSAAAGGRVVVAGQGYTEMLSPLEGACPAIFYPSDPLSSGVTLASGNNSSTLLGGTHAPGSNGVGSAGVPPGGGHQGRSRRLVGGGGDPAGGSPRSPPHFLDAVERVVPNGAGELMVSTTCCYPPAPAPLLGLMGSPSSLYLKRLAGMSSPSIRSPLEAESAQAALRRLGAAAASAAHRGPLASPRRASDSGPGAAPGQQGDAENPSSRPGSAAMCDQLSSDCAFSSRLASNGSTTTVFPSDPSAPPRFEPYPKGGARRNNTRAGGCGGRSEKKRRNPPARQPGGKGRSRQKAVKKVVGNETHNGSNCGDDMTKTLICSDCGELFPNADELAKHMVVHIIAKTVSRSKTSSPRPTNPEKNNSSAESEYEYESRLEDFLEKVSGNKIARDDRRTNTKCSENQEDTPLDLSSAGKIDQGMSGSLNLSSGSGSNSMSSGAPESLSHEANPDPLKPGPDPLKPGLDPLKPGPDPLKPGLDPLKPGPDPLKPGPDPGSPDEGSGSQPESVKSGGSTAGCPPPRSGSACSSTGGPGPNWAAGLLDESMSCPYCPRFFAKERQFNAHIATHNFA